MSRPCLSLLLIGWLVVPALAGDWLHWRGPQQNGAVTHVAPLPDDWSPKTKKNLIWTQPYGCRSTPVLSRGKVYIMSGADEGQVSEQERVVCFDAATGKLIWEQRFGIWLTDIVSNRVGWANLAADGETGNIYAHGIQGSFFCFDGETGKVLWYHSLTEEYGRINGYGGRITTPVVVDDLVLIHNLNASWGDQGRGAHRMFAFDKKTGAVRWWSQLGGQPLDTIQSTPIAVTINGTKLIVVGGADGGFHAVQAGTGKPVWSMLLSRRGLNASPVADANRGWIYITQGEENLAEVVGAADENKQGLVLCVDANNLEPGLPGPDGKVGLPRPKIVWKHVGYKCGFTSPVLHAGRLYVADDAAKLFCLDALTGKEIWSFKYGRTGKGSPVWADGKLYIAEVGGDHWHILKPGEKTCERVSSRNRILRRPSDGPGVVEAYGSPAVGYGRVYFSDSDNLYCIGLPEGKDAPLTVNEDKQPPGAPAQLLVSPNDITLHPGGQAAFRVRVYDAQGRFIEERAADSWSLPTAPYPLPPGAPPPQTPPAPLPALVGSITPQGVLTVSPDVPAQSGLVEAKVALGGKEFTAKGRVRVAPTLPYLQDFEKIETTRIPTGWINLAGKFQVVEVPGGKALKKLANNPSPLLARAYAYISTADLKDYTISADCMGQEKSDGGFTNLPDMGLANCRYTLVLDGNKQILCLRSWEARLRIDKTMPYPWQPNTWYSLKLYVAQENGKAILRGKVWRRDEPEPSAWSLEAEDPNPNGPGAPALYAYTKAIPPDGKGVGTEVFYDNVRVVPNNAK